MDIVLYPHQKFGSVGHNVAISVEGDCINIWAAAVEGNNQFDQCLEIPLKNFTSMSNEMGYEPYLKTMNGDPD